MSDGIGNWTHGDDQEDWSGWTVVHLEPFTIVEFMDRLPWWDDPSIPERPVTVVESMADMFKERP